LAISVDARFRRPVWVADDISLPVLAEIPPRRIQTEPGKVWYDRVSRHPRKAAIQALRAAVEGRLPGRSYSVAIAGIRSGSAMAQAAALDLGVSFASSGWSVLIVDADLDAASPPAELKGAGTSLVQVLNRKSDEPDAPRRLAVEAIEKATVMRPNVSVILAGTGLESSADALSGSNFQVFLEEATSRFDLVLMVGGDLRTPACQVLLQRLDYGIVCMVPGRSSSDIVEDLVEEMGDRGVVFLGATFLHHRGASFDRTKRSDRVVDASPPRVREPRIVRDRVPAPRSSRELDVTRATQGAGAVRASEGRPPVQSARTHKGTTGGYGEVSRPHAVFPVEDDGSELRGQVMQALTDVEQGSYEGVARFMVDCVTALMTDPPNGSDFTNDALMAVRSGFLPLHEVKGYETVSTVLTGEFRNQIGAKLGSWLAAEAAWVLSEGFGATGVTLTLDEWLGHEYFNRHIESSGNEPTVWHLASRHGTVQLLVDSARLNQDCIDELRGSIVQRTIDALERNLKSAVRAGKAEAVERLGELLTDARTFEIALGWLYEGTTPNARLIYPSMLANQQPRGWNPVWSEGVKPNIAPLQRLGLLSVPVLTDEELQSLRPTG
jgi:Mrp family chromosome partitioning ATPase